MTRSGSWQRACALHTMQGGELGEGAALAQWAANDSDPIEREAGETLLAGPSRVARTAREGLPPDSSLTLARQYWRWPDCAAPPIWANPSLSP